MIKILKGIFYYSGFEYIYRKAKPATGLPTLPLWLIGIYIAFFGIAAQRYENRVDIIENRAKSIFTQLDTSARKSALSRIPRVQNYPCPVKPKILNPVSVFRSIFGKNTVYTEMVHLLRETIEDLKEELKDVNLYGAKLVRADLGGVNPEEVNLVRANLEGAILNGSNFQEANLEGTINLTIDQLTMVKTLYKAKLDDELMKQVKEKYPHLLEEPKSAMHRKKELEDSKKEGKAV